jgi:hypothetical protein
MNDDAPFSSIRPILLDTLSDLGVSDPVINKTVVLLRDGYFAGYRFPVENIMVVWLLAEGVVRFYADDGSLLKTLEVGPGLGEKKAA